MKKKREKILKKIKTTANKGLAQWLVKAKIKVSAFYSAKSQLY